MSIVQIGNHADIKKNSIFVELRCFQPQSIEIPERSFLNCLNKEIRRMKKIQPNYDNMHPWDLYSKEQKELRLSLFFYYHEISYLDMVEYNFPNLKRYFKRF